MVAQSHPGAEGKEEDQSSTSGCAHSISLGRNILRLLISDSKETACILIPLHSHWQIWDCTQCEQIPLACSEVGAGWAFLALSLIRTRAISGGLCIPLLNCQHPSWFLTRPLQSWFWFSKRLFRDSYPCRPFPEGQNTITIWSLCTASALKYWKRGHFLYFAGTKVLRRLLWPWLQTMPRRFLQTLLWKWAGKQNIQQHLALQRGEGWALSQKSLEHFCPTGMLGSTRAAPFTCVQWRLWISGSVIGRRENESDTSQMSKLQISKVPTHRQGWVAHSKAFNLHSPE